MNTSNLSHIQYKIQILEHRINSRHTGSDIASLRPSNSSQRSHSKKKKKKERDKSSNSHKKKSSSKPPRAQLPNRPNSAKKFDEFFSDNMPPSKPKRSVPPPPPSSKKQSSFYSMNAPPPNVNGTNQSRSINLHTINANVSHRERNSHSSSHQSMSSLPQSPQPITENIHLTSIVSTDSMMSTNNGHSHKNVDLPMGIPVYQLQTTADSVISTDYSPINGVHDGSNDNEEEKKEDESILPIQAALVKKFPKKHNLKMHRSFNTLPPANIKRPGIKNPNLAIRKNKSYGDQLKQNSSFSDDEYGLSLDQIYQQFNLNDPAVQKLKHLQSSMRRTQQSSADLEQLLSATPPSLPPTPKLDMLTLQKSKSNSLSSCINKYFPEYNSSSNTLNNNSSSNGNSKMLQSPFNPPKHPNNNTMIIKEDVDDIVMQYSDAISPINDHGGDCKGNVMDTDDPTPEEYDDNNNYFDQTLTRKKKSVDMNLQLLQRIDDTEIDSVAFAFPNPSHFDYIHNVLLSSNDRNKSKSTPTTPTPHKYNNYKNQSNPTTQNSGDGNQQNQSEDKKLSTRFNFGRERSLSDSSSKYAALSLRESMSKSKYSDKTIKNMKRQYRNRKNTHLKVHGQYQHNSTTVTHKFGFDVIDLYDFVFRFQS